MKAKALMKSHMDREDRRKLIARLTSKGDAAIKKAFELNLARFRAVFGSLSSADLTSLTAMLQRVRESLAAKQYKPGLDVVKKLPQCRSALSRPPSLSARSTQPSSRHPINRVGDCLPGTSALTQPFAPEPDQSQGPVRFCWRSAAAKHRRIPHAH
jgi:hypothetical protein